MEGKYTYHGNDVVVYIIANDKNCHDCGEKHETGHERHENGRTYEYWPADGDP